VMRVDLEQREQKIPWGCHQVMRVGLEQKIPVHSLSRGEGGPFGNKKFP
jgi:hypothetical protein